MHELLIDGIFFYLRPLILNLSLQQGLGSENRLDYLKQQGDKFICEKFYLQDLNLDLIANSLGVSKRYLSMAYKNAGTTVAKEIGYFRLSRANVMLREDHCKNLTISEIATKNGFKSIAHFSRCYKNKYGISPSEARLREVFD